MALPALKIAFSAASLMALITATDHAHSQVARIESITGLQDLNCASVNSESKLAPCGTYRIQVFPINDEKGVFVGCVAALPYNSLNIHSSTKKESVTVQWTLDTSISSKVSSAKFINSGLDIDNKYSTVITDLVQSLVIDPRDPTKLTLVTAANYGGLTMKFGHQPAVSVRIKSLSVPCTGIDPIITNSAD